MGGDIIHESNPGSVRTFFDTGLPSGSGGVLSRFNENLTVSVDRGGGERRKVNSQSSSSHERMTRVHSGYTVTAPLSRPPPSAWTQWTPS